ncbi:biotin/lipoyl-binding protein [Terasakiispira papahanaumokuakeensis]|uniref:biotin/lipoyl-binding protein n=1 Tax=Terasakiispira papahanaumokuakeensis TaxID=197479 RepID=UPI000A068782|nr:biotin/lipoyl-binding protein [Terasakiispira papahanaumokuakeensis]
MEQSNHQSPSNTLFRQETLDEDHLSHMGQVFIHQPSSYAWMALVAFFLILLVAAFVFWGTHTRKVSAPGLLVLSSGVLRILSPTQGQVLDIKVSEGQHVEKGEPLFIISDERISSSEP